MAEKTPVSENAPKPKRMTAAQRTELAHKLIISSQKGAAEARKVTQEGKETRAKANSLLLPDEVQGEYDLGRALQTTLGGVIRPLTLDDLRRFREHIRSLKGKFKGGIKAKDIIKFSDKDDIERARKQIHSAVPIATKGGTIKFVTNASAGSDRTRHYVNVNMLDFERFSTAPDKHDKIVKAIVGGRLQVSCTCGRWRFWYAYMGLTGGYNANPEHREGAYPKIRNPNLKGLACKHILRVVTNLSQSPTMKNYVGKMVDRERNEVETKHRRELIAEQKRIAAEMAQEKSHHRAIKSEDEKRAQREAQPAYQRRKQEAKVRQEMAAKAKERQKQDKAVSKTKAAAIANFDKLLSLGAITQAQYNDMVKTLG